MAGDRDQLLDLLGKTKQELRRTRREIRRQKREGEGDPIQLQDMLEELRDEIEDINADIQALMATNPVFTKPTPKEIKEINGSINDLRRLNESHAVARKLFDQAIALAEKASTYV